MFYVVDLVIVKDVSLLVSILGFLCDKNNMLHIFAGLAV